MKDGGQPSVSYTSYSLLLCLIKGQFQPAGKEKAKVTKHHPLEDNDCSQEIHVRVTLHCSLTRSCYDSIDKII